MPPPPPPRATMTNHSLLFSCGNNIVWMALPQLDAIGTLKYPTVWCQIHFKGSFGESPFPHIQLIVLFLG